ncbi:hypothetical protein [Microvirga sp. P5_D2]
MAVPFHLGDEQIVSSPLTGWEEQNSTITLLKDGGWLVTWDASNFDDRISSICQQRYDANGNPVGSKSTIFTSVAEYSQNVNVVLLADGGWLVTWDMFDGGTDLNVHQQRYNADGSIHTANGRVNRTATKDQYSSHVTVLKDGGWLVTWTGSEASGYLYDIYQQRFDATGAAIGAPDERVNISTSAMEINPSTTALADGGWIVTWDDHHDVRQQRYNADGTRNGTAVVVSAIGGNNDTKASVIALKDGGWLVVWMSGVSGGGATLYQQRYDRDGLPEGEAARVNASMSAIDDPEALTVKAMSDGGWLVVWQAGPSWGPLYQQRYDRDGQAMFTNAENAPVDQLVSSTHIFGSGAPSVAELPDGSWVITWANGGESNGAVRQRRFELNFAPDALSLEGQETKEDAVSGTIIGTLKPNDGNNGDVFTYTLLDDPEGRFEIKDGKLLLKDPGKIDHEKATSHQIRVKVSDKAGASFTETFIIQVKDTPDEVSLSGNEVRENAAKGTVVGKLLIADRPEGSVTYEVLDGVGTIFEVVDGQLVVKDGTALDYETGALRQIRIKVTDGAGETHIETLKIKLLDVPEYISLTGQAVAENALAGTVVGTLKSDQDAAQPLQYRLLDDAGGRFAIVDDRLVVKDGGKLDYEAATSHQIKVQVTDWAGATHETMLTVLLQDGLDILRGTKGKDALIGTVGSDRIYGELGNDTLTGKAGQDVFVFGTKLDKKKNLDGIADFNVVDDTIWLDNAVFKKLGKGTELNPGKLNKKFFTIGDKAKDKDDYLIYNKKNGTLSYDQDGFGEKAAVEFAKLSKNLKLTVADFFII